MQNPISRMLTSLIVAVLLLASFAHGQFAEQFIRVRVPFQFTADHKVFAAGEYWFVRTASDRLDVRDARGQVLASVITHPVQSAERIASTKLEFSTVGGAYTLTRLWTKGDLFGNELPASGGTTAVARRNKEKPGGTGGGANQ